MIQEFRLPSGQGLQIDTNPLAGANGFRQNSSFATPDLSVAMQPLREFCEVVLDKVQGLSSEPESIELSLGISLSAEGSIIVAKGKAESNISVKIIFKRV